MKFIYTIAAALSVAALSGAIPVDNEERAVAHAGLTGFAGEVVVKRDEIVVLKSGQSNVRKLSFRILQIPLTENRALQLLEVLKRRARVRLAPIKHRCAADWGSGDKKAKKDKKDKKDKKKVGAPRSTSTTYNG